MSEKKASPPPFEQSAYQRAELDALHRMLTISEGTFSLSIAICNSPVLRNHLISHITQETNGIEVVRIGPDTLDVFDFVQQQIGDRQPEAVFVAEVEKALTDENKDRVLQNLNVSRESWRSRCPCPVVFWLPEYVSALLATRARDLWSWVSHHFEFVSEQATALAGLQDSYSGDLLSAENLDAHEKQFRIAELEQRINDLDKEPAEQVRGHAFIWLNELAHLYEFVGEWDQAEQAFQRFLRWTKPKEEELRATGFHGLGRVYTDQGNYARALDSFERCRRITQELGNRKGLATCLHSIGMVYQLCDDYDKALEYYEQSRNIKEELGDSASLSATLQQIGTVHEIRGAYDLALEYYERSRRFLEELGNRAGLSKCFHNIGMIQHHRGDYDQALEYYEKSRRISEDLGDRRGISSSLHSMGNLYQERGDYDEALGYYEQARGIAEELRDRNLLSASLNGIGAIHQRRGELTSALQCYEQSVKLNEELGDLKGLSTSLHQIGMVYQHQRDYDKALTYYKQSLEISEKLGNRRGLSKSLHQIGILCQLRGDYDGALKYFERSRKIVEELSDRGGLAISHGQMGSLCAATGKYSDALEHSLKALLICEQIGSPNSARAVNALRQLRQRWGSDQFDKAWREKTREAIPDWLK